MLLFMGRTDYRLSDYRFRIFSSDIKLYMRLLEEVMIKTIAHFGIEGYGLMVQRAFG